MAIEKSNQTERYSIKGEARRASAYKDCPSNSHFNPPWSSSVFHGGQNVSGGGIAGVSLRPSTSCFGSPGASVRCRAHPCALFLPLVGADSGKKDYTPFLPPQRRRGDRSEDANGGRNVQACGHKAATGLHNFDRNAASERRGNLNEPPFSLFL